MMSGGSIFSVFVHGLGANLDLDDMSMRVKNPGMDGLITVGLGLGDVVGDTQMRSRFEVFVNKT